MQDVTERSHGKGPETIRQNLFFKKNADDEAAEKVTQTAAEAQTQAEAEVQPSQATRTLRLRFSACSLYKRRLNPTWFLRAGS